MPYFSVIIPVYNRRDEVNDLLASLAEQSNKDFEVMIVEDGSTVKCDDIVAKYTETVDVHYYYKENEGRSIARNYGIEHASGSYFIFFDSDCVIPKDYFKTLREELDKDFVPCFGGPDAADASFTDVQKAINFSMTAFLTTGGIRGGKVQLEKFVPRSFNMGYSREVWEKVGGFREMFSEDIDMSTRVRKAGFPIKLVRDAFVYHKRRVSLKSFSRQTYVFGMSRITLKLLYPRFIETRPLSASRLCPRLSRTHSACHLLAVVGNPATRALHRPAVGKRTCQDQESQNFATRHHHEFHPTRLLRYRVYQGFHLENSAEART
jgi:GT2 family glycosyltransferase